jgi:FkbM family methyltransferase
MIVLGRHLENIPQAILDRRRYRTFGHMYSSYPRFWKNLGRFLSARGAYPYVCEIRTPIGIVSPTLYSSHDFFTMNEIFCRSDYELDSWPSTVVDIGSNIGMSALYFLTRSKDNYCYLYEPNPANVERLKRNLSHFEERISLSSSAVGNITGDVAFGIEPTGRYGGIGVKTSTQITVPCLHINDVIENALKKNDRVDLLKIDTEGAELATVQAIDPRFYPRIRRIYFEAEPPGKVLPPPFKQEQHWTICRLINS